MKRQWSVLVRFPDFRRLLIGNSVSLMGSSVTTVALPLTAVLYLHASPAQMGFLGAVAFVPPLLLGLPAGVWVDRWPYRRVLVLCDLLQMLVLGAVPVLASVHALQLWQLYVVVTLSGLGSLFVTVAGQSFTPVLVPREELLGATSALAMSDSTVNTTGTALGGALVSVLTAPVAIAADAASFLFSALCKARIRTPGAGHQKSGQRSNLRRDILEGLRAVVDHPVIRAVTFAATLGALAGQIQSVVLVLYFVRVLHLPASLVGVTIAVSGAAAIVGALIVVPVTERLGHGPTFIAGMFLTSLSGIVTAVAGGPLAAILLILLVAQLLRGTGPSFFGVNQRTLRLTYIPPELISRTQATWRFLVYGGQPIGALLGGLFASIAGLRATLIISGAGQLVATAIAYFSPLRNLRDITTPSLRERTA